ncbi:MAG: alanine racemase [Acidimicrobiia bacterium]|nr:alanine racemase [Acidimicrobiia bacterium]
MTGQFRPSSAHVDLDAVAANVSYLADLAAPAVVCAVVKADGYGHGAAAVARAALEAGAGMLGVALVEEVLELRATGIGAPVLLLSQAPAGSEAAVVEAGATATVYTASGIDALAAAASAAGQDAVVHLKVNTGMNRVGCQPEDAVALARRVVTAPGLHLGGTWTHFAVADEPDLDYTAAQAKLFDAVVADIEADGIDPGTLHAANSAATLADPERYRYGMVRCGIAIYGIAPAPGLAGCERLRPAMSLRSELTHVRRLEPGERISYGLRYTLDRESWIGTVPLGYHDGVRRALSGKADVLVGGVRRPVAGTITMDQFMVDLGTDEVPVGSEVVLIGRQGDEEIRAEEWAALLGTIGYEITCGISARVPRVHERNPT